MDRNHQRLNIAKAKEMDLVDYLSSLGYQPTKIRNADYWYLSPLREERTPSFKVNRKLNCWYDHGLGKGGNLIDFGILYHHCTVSELLQNLDNGFSFHQPIARRIEPSQVEEKDHHLRVLDDNNLRSFALLRYLEERKIPLQLAEVYCREIGYALKEKTYYGIGFRNDSGGYEIRNPYIKLSSAPKDVTSIGSGANEVAVFEGFMDFLSFKAIQEGHQERVTDFVILNSAALFEKARPFMEQHESIRLYLDHDETGQNCSRNALAISSKYKDESSLYQNYKDLNDWLMNSGRGERKHFRAKLP